MPFMAEGSGCSHLLRLILTFDSCIGEGIKPDSVAKVNEAVVLPEPGPSHVFLHLPQTESIRAKFC